jgi:hypothetical protein
MVVVIVRSRWLPLAMNSIETWHTGYKYFSCKKTRWELEEVTFGEIAIENFGEWEFEVEAHKYVSCRRVEACRVQRSVVRN